MPLLRTSFSKITKNLAVALLFTNVTFCSAGDREEIAAVSSMIAIVESNKLDQVDQAKKLFDSIPSTSKSKPIAAYSLALVHIRERQYLEAWKLLATTPKESDSESNSIKVGREKLKLWLRLEVGPAEKAELQFKQLLTMALDTELPIGDQTAVCGFIGGVVGMLKADGESSFVLLPMLDEAKEQIKTKVKAMSTKTEFEKQVAEASDWGAELSTLVSTFESIGTEKADKQNQLTQAEFKRVNTERMKLREDLKVAGKDKRDLETNRRSAIKNHNAAKANLRSEIGKKPAPPVHPGPSPSKPRRPVGHYKADPKTQERSKYEEPSAKEIKEYEQELAMFNTWPARAAKFESDSAAYPAKIQLWEQRVATLEQDFKAAKDQVAASDRAIKDMQAGINQGVGNDLKETSDQLEKLKRTAAISKIAFHHINSNESKNESAIRPSNFQLIDFASECMRIRKSLR